MWIKTYIMTIVSVILISVIAESLMPETNAKRHISLVAGLMIIFSIAKPIISLPKFNFESIENILSEEGIITSNEITEKISETQAKEINRNFKNALSESIAENLNKNFGSEYELEIVMSDTSIDCISLNCTADSKIKSYIENTYGIKCMFVEG